MSTVLDPAAVVKVLIDELANVPATAVAAAAARVAEIEAVRRAVGAAEGVPDDLTAEPLIRLFGIDLVLLSLVPDFTRAADSARGGWLGIVQTRLLRYKRFDDPASTDGALLPRRAAATRQGPADYLVDALMSCVRIPKQHWDRVEWCPVPRRLDLPPWSRLSSRRLAVAAVAAADDLDDFAIEPVRRGGYLGYRLRPNPARIDDARIDELAAAIDASGAVVAVLPEGVLDDEVLARWRERLRSSGFASTQCRWVLLGTGPVGGGDPPANRAVLVHRPSAEPILTQDKRDRFNLRPDHVAAYRLSHRLPDDGIHVEHIEPGVRLTVAESAIGRFCVLVCEDLDRLVQDGQMLRDLGVSHVLVPIFSQEIVDGNWETSKAGDLARQVGATVVVVNSLAVPRAREAAGVVGSEWMTSFARVATDPDVGYGHVMKAQATSPVEAVVFMIASGDNDAFRS